MIFLLTCINLDNRSKRYIFASASFCLVLAMIGLVCGFFETLNSFGGRASSLQESGKPEEVPCSLDEKSKVLIEGEDNVKATWGYDAER